jgi:hypothetical protein
MTEVEWLACTDPARIVRSLQGRGGTRPPRLWACAFFRWDRSDVGMLMRAVQVAEAWADREEPTTLTNLSGFYVTDRVAWRAAERSARFVASWEESAQQQHAIGFQIRSLYCIFGNPFRPMAVEPSWLTWRDGTVPKIAQSIYDNRILPSGTLDPTSLANLADALEEAGCDNADILNHCRQPGEHVRGCWVVDLLIGKQ